MGGGAVLVIGGTAPRGSRRGRTRAFRAELLGMLVADGLWERGGGEATRPVWLAVAAGEQALAPFVANLRLGRPALLTRDGEPNGNEEKIELLRGAGYRHLRARVDAGETRVAVGQAWLPALCDLEGDGRADEEGRVALAAICPADWAAREAKAMAADPARLAATLAHAGRAGIGGPKGGSDRSGAGGTGAAEGEILALAAAAAYAAALLDRRLGTPLPPGPGFALRLLAALHRAGLARLATKEPATAGDPFAALRSKEGRLLGTAHGVAEAILLQGDAEILDREASRTAAAYVADRRAGMGD